MSRFTQELLPEAIVQTKAKLENLEHAQRSIVWSIEHYDEWADHRCDCEFCGSKELEVITPAQREEYQAIQAKNAEEITVLQADVISMENYHKFAEKNNL